MQVGLPVSLVVSFPLSLLTCVLHTLSLQVRGLYCAGGAACLIGGELPSLPPHLCPPHPQPSGQNVTKKCRLSWLSMGQY
jgi:hypothetical protein